MTLIERMARAAAEFDKRPFEAMGRADRERYLARARVEFGAIRESLREITPAMERAFHAACDEHGHVLWKSGYRAVIDAILAEQGESKS